jgi:superfamily II DNA/RNA helicase
LFYLYIRFTVYFSLSHYFRDEENNAKRQKTKEEEESDKLTVSNFRVSQRSIEMLKGRGIEKFFPIQAQTYDLIYEGKDIVGRAQTGSGKTISFALPVCEKLLLDLAELRKTRFRTPSVICMAPTRELAKQNAEEFQRCCHKELSVVAVYGGVPIRDHCTLFYFYFYFIATPYLPYYFLINVIIYTF